MVTKAKNLEKREVTGDAPGKADAPLPYDSHLALFFRMLKIGAMVTTPIKKAVCIPNGVPQAELKLLMVLAGEGALAGHDITLISGISPMNVSRGIAALSERGWVEAVPDAENRRRRPVQLTEAGLAAYESLGPDLTELADEIASCFTARQRDRFAKLSDKAIESLGDWIHEHEEH